MTGTLARCAKLAREWLSEIMSTSRIRIRIRIRNTNTNTNTNTNMNTNTDTNREQMRSALLNHLILSRN
jgi:hypothetical protein